jgi:derlin-1
MTRGSKNGVFLMWALAVSASARTIPSTTQATRITTGRSFGLSKEFSVEQSSTTAITENILSIRGGAAKRKKKSGGRTNSLYTATGQKKVQSGNKETKSAMAQTLTKYKGILPLTRLYITLVGVTTVIGVVLGDEMAGAVLALDPIRTIYGMELWRPLTAATFLGPPSIGWLMNAYYLFEYGSSLEKAYGTAQHVIFLLTQIAVLTVCSMIFGLPFFTSSVITAMLHVLSRSMPDQKVKWLIFTVPYWTLPYGLMLSDVLQAQSPAAALPHILGILSGHVYFFHKFVWPKQDGGEDWLIAPDFLSRRLDPDARLDDSREMLNKTIRRKKGKGRKLGSK